MRTTYRSLLAAAVFVLASVFSSAAADSSADHLISEAIQPSPIETNLHNLADGIGARVPATPGMEKAVQSGVEALKAAGADTVHPETVTLPRSSSEVTT